VQREIFSSSLLLETFFDAVGMEIFNETKGKLIYKSVRYYAYLL
jgi:hypothetical protein